MIKLFSKSSTKTANQNGNARKVDESNVRSSSEPMQYKESTLNKIMKRLSISATSSASNLRKSFVMNKRQSKAIKDGVVSTVSVSASAVASTSMRNSTNSSTFEVVMVESPAKSEPSNKDNESDMIKIIKPALSQDQLNIERTSMEKNFGIESTNIIYNIAKEFEPIVPKSGLIDPKSLSSSTISLCGCSAPAITIVGYLSRIVENINFVMNESDKDIMSTGIRCLIIGAIYIKRVMKMNNEFEINGLNIHRLLLVAISDAVKVNEDVVPSNKFLAEVGGVDVPQLTILEASFCNLLKHRLVVDPDELEQAYRVYHDKSFVMEIRD